VFYPFAFADFFTKRIYFPAAQINTCVFGRCSYYNVSCSLCYNALSGIKKIFDCFVLNVFFNVFIPVLYSNGQIQKADVYWSTAYIDAPDYHLVHNGLAKVYLSAGDYEQYKNFIYEAYRLSYGDRYIFDITSILIHEGNTDEAEKICLNILSDSRNKPFLKFGSMSTLGEIYLKKNNIKKATSIQRSFQNKPLRFDVSEKLEQIKTMLKNRQNAV
jgi:tetratricopeptide (TPR) repeat protein